VNDPNQTRFDQPDDDDDLLRIVREALDEGPSLLAHQRAARANRHACRHHLLAEVDADSHEDGLLVRSNATADRALCLTAGALSVELELLEEDGSIVGQVIPAEPATIAIEQFPDGLVEPVRLEVATDRSGRFDAVLRPGPLRVAIDNGTDRLVSPWITR